MTNKDVVVYLDENDEPTAKEKAVKVRILTTDAQGNRLEVYGEINKLEAKP
jgi:hypothetical protein